MHLWCKADRHKCKGSCSCFLISTSAHGAGIGLQGRRTSMLMATWHAGAAWRHVLCEPEGSRAQHRKACHSFMLATTAAWGPRETAQSKMLTAGRLTLSKTKGTLPGAVAPAMPWLKLYRSWKYCVDDFWVCRLQGKQHQGKCRCTDLSGGATGPVCGRQACGVRGLHWVRMEDREARHRKRTPAMNAQQQGPTQQRHGRAATMHASAVTAAQTLRPPGSAGSRM